MSVKLKSLKLSNFLSHQSTKIDFSDVQKILLDGKSGAGKSSIIEALVWGLYEKGRSDNRSMVRHGAPKMEVIIDLENDEKKYKIVRTVTNKGKHTLEVFNSIGEGKYTPVDALGIKGVQDFIENKILKSSYLLFVNSVAYLQDGGDSFVKQTAVKRKDILLEIANSATYDALYNKTKDAIKVREGKVSLEEATIKYLESDIQKYEVSLLEKQNLTISRNLDTVILDGCLLEIKKALGEKEANATQAGALAKVYALVTETTHACDQITEELNKKTKTMCSLPPLDTEAMKKEVEKIALVTLELSAEENKHQLSSDWSTKMMEIIRERPAFIDYETKIKLANSNIIQILQEKIELCPELDKECPLLEKKRQERIAYLETEMVEQTRQWEDFKDKSSLCDIKAAELGEKPLVDSEKVLRLTNELKRLRNIEIALSRAESEKNLYESLTEDVRLLKVRLGNASQDKTFAIERYEQLLEVTTPHTDFDARIQENSLQAENLRRTIAEKDARLLLLDSFEKKIGEIRAEVVKKVAEIGIVRQELADLLLLKDAFGANGVKSIMIDFIIPRLEESINRILHQLSDFTVRLDTQKQGVGGGVVLEGLFISIFNDRGEEFDFGSYSGGERVRISMAINEALAEISSIDFRLMDESIISLDNDSTERFLTALGDIQARVSQILCISHIQEIKDFFKETIVIKKKNGISVIE